MEESNKSEINIEKIMQEIRREILQKKRIGKRELPTGGKRFSPDFYEQIYQAELLQGDLGIKMTVTKTEIPVLGPLIDRFRTKIHEVVLFYVNQALDQQAEINDHIIQAVILLSKELEEGFDEGGKNTIDGQ